MIPSGESTGGPSEYNRQKSGQHTEQQLLTEIVDLLGEPATASNAYCTAWTHSSCALRPRKKLSDKQKAKGFVSSQVYFCAPKYILSGYFHKAILLTVLQCCYRLQAVDLVTAPRKTPERVVTSPGPTSFPTRRFEFFNDY